MNIKELHPQDKTVSVVSLFIGTESNIIAMQILAGQVLKEHVTKIPALLICIEGNVVFENENGIKEILLPGDYVNIEPMVKHWVNGIVDSQLLLIK